MKEKHFEMIEWSLIGVVGLAISNGPVLKVIVEKSEPG